jgi:hypothetical protein
VRHRWERSGQILKRGRFDPQERFAALGVIELDIRKPVSGMHRSLLYMPCKIAASIPVSPRRTVSSARNRFS